MNSDIKNLPDLIASKEAPRGYDQMYWKAEKALGRYKLSAMTLDQIASLQMKMKPYGSTASGRYQFIRATFDETRSAMGLPKDTVWTPEVQDNMAMHLLNKRGLTKFLAGDISRIEFANNLAKEWASLPVVTAIRGHRRLVVPGESYYAGDGLNKAFHKPEKILMAIDAIQGQPVVIPPVPVPVPTQPSVISEGLQRLVFTIFAFVIIVSIIVAVYYMWK